MIQIKKKAVIPGSGVCFWCGDDDSTVELARLPGDEDKPRYMVFEYRPCSKCEEYFKQGIVCVEVGSASELRRLPVVKGLAPTGRFSIVPAESIKEPLKDLYDSVVETGSCLLSQDMYEFWFGGHLGTIKEDENDKDNSDDGSGQV